MKQFSMIRRISHLFILLPMIGLTISTNAKGNTEDSADIEATADTRMELDLATVIRSAIEWNREINIAGFEPDIARQDVEEVDSVYDLTIFSTGGLTRTDRSTQTTLDTGSEEIDELIEDRWLVQAGVRKLVSTGGSISLYQEVDNLDSNSEFVQPNPQNTSRLRVGLEQPLLKNIGDQENRAAKETALTNVVSAQEHVQLKTANVVYQVILSYWRLWLETNLNHIHSENLKLAEDISKQEQERHSLGISRQIDVDRALSAIETRRSRLIRSINRKKTAFHRLRLLVNAPSVFSEIDGIEIIPTEQPVTTLPYLSASNLLDEALQKRPEAKIANYQLANAEISKKLYGHLQLPELSARADYTLNSLADDAGDAFSDVYSSGNDGWSVWLNFEFPLGNNGAQAEFRKAELTYRQAQEKAAHTRDVIFQEIYSIAEETALSHKQIAAALTAREAAERVLDSEMASYEITRTTNKDLLQAQDALAIATAEYHRALSEYNMKLAQLNRARGTTLEDFAEEL